MPSNSNALLSAVNPNWLTPLHIIERSRLALGGTIELDPASCTLANVSVRAECYYETSGLARSWRAGTIFLNPPGGRISDHSRTKSSPVAWWLKLVSECQANGSSAIFVAFAAGSFLQAAQKAKGFKPYPEWPLHHSVCFLKDRLRFDLSKSDMRAMLLAQIAKSKPGKAQEKLGLEFDEVDNSPANSRFSGPSPTHGNAIIGINIKRNLFQEAFQDLGQFN